MRLKWLHLDDEGGEAILLGDDGRWDRPLYRVSIARRADPFACQPTFTWEVTSRKKCGNCRGCLDDRTDSGGEESHLPCAIRAAKEYLEGQVGRKLEGDEGGTGTP